MSENLKILIVTVPLSLIGALAIIAAMFADNIAW